MLRTRLTPAAVLFAALLASACVPTTQTTVAEDGVTQIANPGPIDTSTAYLATADSGFDVPAVPVEQVPEPYRRQLVVFETDQAPGTVIINPSQRVLHFVLGNGQAIRYGIAVGRDGFEWSGEALVTNRRPWPTWTPPKEMIERKPELAKWEEGQPGGPTNPLGARALYLTTNGVDYGYRIHGTPEWDSIGSNASSGCIRMINQDVMDLYNRVPDGAKVIVMTRDGQMPTGLTLPPPQPRRETPRQTPRTVRSQTPDPLVVAPTAVPPLPPRLPIAPDLIVAPQPATPATPAAPAPAVAAPVLTAPAVTAPAITAPAVATAPATTTPVAPVPAATAPACVPTATTPCPPAGN